MIGAMEQYRIYKLYSPFGRVAHGYSPQHLTVEVSMPFYGMKVIHAQPDFIQL